MSLQLKKQHSFCYITGDWSWFANYFSSNDKYGSCSNLFPVTGQTLPLISSGGTSIWMTCFALGMILSVSASKDETEETILDDNPLDILHEAID